MFLAAILIQVYTNDCYHFFKIWIFLEFIKCSAGLVLHDNIQGL